MIRYCLLLALALSGAATAQTAEDISSPVHNAVVSVGPCSGTLLTPSIVLTVGHCLPVTARAERPFDASPPACNGLEQQANLAHTPWENDYQWYRLRNRLTVKIGVRQSADRQKQLAIAADSYAIAHCADLALLRLSSPVPRHMATPMAVVTSVEVANALSLGTARLRFAGWGALSIAHAPRTHRATGDAPLVAHNTCHLFALPPLRITGARILPGDSGSPLLYHAPDGTQAVVGVLYGKNVLDRQVCGLPARIPPPQHGTYTPTFRPALPDTDATDIGDWLGKMARGLHAYAP